MRTFIFTDVFYFKFVKVKRLESSAKIDRVCDCSVIVCHGPMAEVFRFN